MTASICAVDKNEKSEVDFVCLGFAAAVTGFTSTSSRRCAKAKMAWR